MLPHTLLTQPTTKALLLSSLGTLVGLTTAPSTTFRAQPARAGFPVVEITRWQSDADRVSAGVPLVQSGRA
jgi:hypothetical protein